MTLHSLQSADLFLLILPLQLLLLTLEPGLPILIILIFLQPPILCF